MSEEFYHNRLRFLREYVEIVRHQMHDSEPLVLINRGDLETVLGDCESLALTFERLIPVLVRDESERERGGTAG